MAAYALPPLPPSALDKSYPLTDLGLPLSAPPAVNIYDPTALGLDFGLSASMHDDEHNYWAAATAPAPAPAQPAYNSFMYPAPQMPAAQPQPQVQSQTAWSPNHTNPMGTYEEHVPSIRFEADAYPMHAQPQPAAMSWNPQTFSPPTTMPDMIAPNTPSSEGGHSPALQDNWALPTAQVAEWRSPMGTYTQSVQSSPATNVQDLFYNPSSTTGVWDARSPFSPVATDMFSQHPGLNRGRSSSDGEIALQQFSDNMFAPGSPMSTASSGVHRRHSTHGPGASAAHLTPDYGVHRSLSSAPYAAARSARGSPAGSRDASPIGRVLTRSPSASDATGLDDADVSNMVAPVIAKQVVTTDPVSEASARRRTHEARFECDICGKRLTTKTNLEGHRKSHLGVKEFQCGVCDKPFTRDWDRKRHEKTHSKKAELACDICGKTSTRKDAFDKHRCRAPANVAAPQTQAPTASLPHSFF